MSWKREMQATIRDRGLHGVITGTEVFPTTAMVAITQVAGVVHVGTTPLSELENKWWDKNNSAYSQILLCISPELQASIDDTELAAEAWSILVKLRGGGV